MWQTHFSVFLGNLGGPKSNAICHNANFCRKPGPQPYLMKQEVSQHNWLGSTCSYQLQLSAFPKTDLKNHSNRGFDEMTSIVAGNLLELLLAVHDAPTNCIDVSMRVGLRTILPLGTEIALTLVAWKWTLGGHPFLRHACPFLDSLGKEKQVRRSSKVGLRESKNRHVWQDHFWARAYKRLPSLFRDRTSIAAWFKLFSKPFANHLLFLSTRYLELWRSFHRSLYWNGFSGPFLGTQKVALGSCMCFQAGCGEIQPCFMRYCWGPGLFATEICITVEAPLKTVAEFPPFMAPEDIRFGATLRNDSDNFSPAFAG